MGILDLSNGEHEDCVILAGFVPLQAGFIKWLLTWILYITAC